MKKKPKSATFHINITWNFEGPWIGTCKELPRLQVEGEVLSVVIDKLRDAIAACVALAEECKEGSEEIRSGGGKDLKDFNDA